MNIKESNSLRLKKIIVNYYIEFHISKDYLFMIKITEDIFMGICNKCCNTMYNKYITVLEFK